MFKFLYTEIKKEHFRIIPIFGDLIDCRISDHSEAFKEFIIGLIFSTMPIWLGTLVNFVIIDAENHGFLSSLKNTISYGELFIYCNATLAPIFYNAIKDEKGMPNFPGQFWHIFLVILISIICSAFFSLQRTNVNLDTEIIFPSSIGLYLFSLILFYLSMVYKNNRLTGALDVRKTKTNEFVGDFNRRHQNA